MRVGEGAGKFLGDLHNGESDETLRKRWKAGEYGTGKHAPRAQDVREWRRLAGRE